MKSIAAAYGNRLKYASRLEACPVQLNHESVTAELDRHRFPDQEHIGLPLWGTGPFGISFHGAHIIKEGGRVVRGSRGRQLPFNYYRNVL